MSQQIPPGGAPLPQEAQDRLARTRGDATHRGVFTSDLSVNEFLLTREAGFEALGLVVGSSFYHIGYQRAGLGKNVEMTLLSQAMYNARSLAMTRMEQEAMALGADGIIGVRLQVSRFDWGENMAEFVAIGTAVRARNGQSWRTIQGLPFTSDLSGQDFWTLLKAGYRPAGLVMGTCVYHIAYQSFRQTLGQIGRNVELPHFTQSFYTSRELAMDRMQYEAQKLGANGIVGTRIVQENHGWGSHVIEFLALGTAVISMSDTHEVEPPKMVLGLDG